MSWTTPDHLRAEVQKLWDKGLLLGGEDAATWPRHLRLKAPSSAELSSQFAAVQLWVAQLAAMPQVRLEWRVLRHRVIGSNRLPDAVWLDTPEAALALIGKQAEAAQFSALLAHTQKQLPAVVPWLHQQPLQALHLISSWPRLLTVVRWMQQHPRPEIHVRQMDVAGVDSKFVEAHRSVLSALFDLALPASAVNTQHQGISGFARRYGFLEDPPRIRFRILDPALALLAGGSDQDYTLRHDAFAALQTPARRVFITENKTNFLAFPPCPDSLVIFGGGYGFEMLAEARWLQHCTLHYWGDIDTHGFAILSQLRAHFPHTQSLLMDAETLLAHQSLWGNEPMPVRHDLQRLTATEQTLFDDLRDNRLGTALRLEQERIGYRWLLAELARLSPANIALNHLA